VIPAIIQFAAFFSLALMIRSRTYTLLTVFSFVNLVADQLTNSDGLYLMVVYSLIDYITIMALIAFGDIHRMRQVIILALMISLHALLEYDQSFGTNIVFDWYVYGISALILAQLAGARGVINRVDSAVSWSSVYFGTTGKYALQNSSHSNLSNQD